jgi:hypothetical protein
MKKQNLFLLINFVIMLLIGLVFAMVNQNQTMTEPKDKLFEQRITLENEQKLSSIPLMSANSSNFEIVDMKWTAKDEDGKTIGFVYHAVIKNDFALSGSGIDYGFIEILVGITLDNKVHVEYVNVYQSQWAIVGIQKYIQDNYDGVNHLIVGTIPSFDADIVSGATDKPATVSTDAIKALVQSVVAIHYNIVDEDPYEDIFETDAYEFQADSTFTSTTHITEKVLVTDGTNSLGYIYSVTGSGEYQDGSTDSIVIEIIFGTDDTIIGFVLPEDTYNHSGGSFKEKNQTYLENYIGLSISEIQAVVDAGGSQDVTSGASNTRALIDELLEAFVSEVN